MQHELCLVLDFGAQYAQLIARRVRECGVYCRIVPFNITAAALAAMQPKALILSGGPASVLAEGAPKIDSGILQLNLPVLGICYGQQLLGRMLGGAITPAKHREYGHAELLVDVAADPLFKGVSAKSQVWMSHGDTVTKLPDGFRVCAHTATAPMAAFSDPARKCAGVQFHPEVTHTLEGKRILANFLTGYAGFKGDWQMGDFIAEATVAIREKVGANKVILGLSGGVDSSVAAVLIHRAIGEQLQCIFIDNGVVRKNEAQQVEKTFRDHYHIPLKVIDAGQEFLGALAGVLDPERKRKIIGEIFVRIFEREARLVKDAKFLAQGTLYPDVIESVAAHGGPTAVIKSHHNVGGLPEKMNLALLEPFRELFKDEVRALGRQLKMPEQLVGRQPFPGPGLAVRIVGEVTPERVEILQNSDVLVEAEIRAAGLYDKLWQSFAVLLPVKSVGVQGDERTYAYTICLRAVESTDGMTADWADLPRPLLMRISNRIINEVHGVNRVVYDISSKPPATIEWE